MGKDLIVSRGLVKHNGAFYEAGDIIEGLSLDDKKRAELLEYGQAYEAETEDDTDAGDTGQNGSDDAGGSSENGSGTGGADTDGSDAGGSGENDSGTGGADAGSTSENGSNENGADTGSSGTENTGENDPPLAAAKVQKMSKDDLLALAAEKNVDIASCTNNDQRSAAIIAALGLQ